MPSNDACINAELRPVSPCGSGNYSISDIRLIRSDSDRDSVRSIGEEERRFISHFTTETLPVNGYVVHSWCLETLNKAYSRASHSQQVMLPKPLYMLCSTIANSSDCSDCRTTRGFSTPKSNPAACDAIDVESGQRRESTITSLPVEIQLMILEFLPHRALINFFFACKQILGLAQLFLTTNELLPSLKGPNRGNLAQQLIEMTEAERHDFVIQASIARYISRIPKAFPLHLFQALLQGQVLDVQMSGAAQLVDVFFFEISNRAYVRGLEFLDDSGVKVATIGHCNLEIGRKYRQRLSAPLTCIAQTMDEFGVRALRFGEDAWIPAPVDDATCWKGHMVSSGLFHFKYEVDVSISYTYSTACLS